jgi:hypothetical protein
VVKATLVGPAPRLDISSQFIGHWYEANDGAAAKPSIGVMWRPGLQVKALVRTGSAEAQQAMSVPADAVLYHLGQAIVYVRLAPGKYQRRPVQLLGREDNRWILALRQGEDPAGLLPGEPVASRHAQILLSEESLGH